MSEANNIPLRVVRIVEDVCDNYCKYHDIYQARYEDPDVAMTEMQNDVCCKCPLSDLI